MPAGTQVLAQSLAAVFDTSRVGIAIFDRNLRYLTINEALASMNGYPASAHLGKTIRQLFGTTASRIEEAAHQVFSTGRPLYNLEITARLPGRKETGHWLDSYYPIKDKRGKTYQMVALIVDVTKRRKLERSVRQLIDRLIRAELALTNERSLRSAPDSTNGAAFENLRAVRELLGWCLSDAHRIALLVRPELLLGTPSIPTHSQPFLSPSQLCERSADGSASQDRTFIRNLREIVPSLPVFAFAEQYDIAQEREVLLWGATAIFSWEDEPAAILANIQEACSFDRSATRPFRPMT